MKKQGFCVHLGGNIGHPLFSEAETIHPEDYAVLELSSFQLHSMDAHPNVAVITNISPNHLDKHLDYKDYYDSKANIFIKQTAEDHLILNANDEMTPYYENMSSGSISYFAREQAVSNGVYSEGDSIYSIYPGDKPHLIMSASDIILPGVHNLEKQRSVPHGGLSRLRPAGKWHILFPEWNTGWNVCGYGMALPLSMIPSERAQLVLSQDFTQ